ncbi:MAG: serine acetyltransferase, partial [Candidatus Muiribacteriota bacterium]
KFHIGEEVNVLFKKLSDQITRSIKHDCLRYDRECSDCVETGFSKALLFLEKIVYLREMLAKDVRAAIDGDPAAKSPDEVIFSYPGFFAIMIYRIAHELFKMEIPIMPRIMTEYAHSQTGVDIHPGASIDESFFIDHGTGVVIGETTIIGKKVRVYQGVTLGALSIKKLEDGSFDLKTKRHPTIEDEAILYSNCTILGGKTVIGKKAVIGGNVWVTESVPPGSVILIKNGNETRMKRG